MKKPPKKSSAVGTRRPQGAGQLERADSLSHRAKYFLRLYISGSTSKSSLAVENAKRICEQHLKNRYDLEVIDIYQQPDLARNEQIVAVPTLVKRLPLPLRRLLKTCRVRKCALGRRGLVDAGRSPPGRERTNQPRIRIG
jgi:circadian clock protein KaiB